MSMGGGLGQQIFYHTFGKGAGPLILFQDDVDLHAGLEIVSNLSVHGDSPSKKRPGQSPVCVWRVEVGLLPTAFFVAENMPVGDDCDRDELCFAAVFRAGSHCFEDPLLEREDSHKGDCLGLGTADFADQ